LEKGENSETVVDGYWRSASGANQWQSTSGV